MIGSDGANSPSRMCRSVPQMPQAATSTTTSRGPGTGSSTVITSTSLTALMTAARTAPPPSLGFLSCTNRHGGSPGCHSGPLLDRAHRQATDQLVLRRPPSQQDRQACDRGGGRQVRYERPFG